MVYDLAEWFWQKFGALWRRWGRAGGLGRLVFLAPVAALSFACAALSALLYAASFMRIFENVARWLFQSTRNGLTRAGLLGKVFWLPLFLGACGLCLLLIVVTIGQAIPFTSARA